MKSGYGKKSAGFLPAALFVVETSTDFIPNQLIRKNFHHSVREGKQVSCCFLASCLDLDTAKKKTTQTS